MPIETEQTCEKCGKKYWQGDLMEDIHLICDECRGRPKQDSDNSIKSKQEWLEAITKHQRRS